ncbi:transcription termination factor 1, mitochondrial [Spinachia spinachia]
MAAVAGLNAFLSFYRSAALQRPLAAQWTSTFPHRGLCGVPTKTNKPKTPTPTENESLLDNLNLMGVDVKRARQRQPGVLRKPFTNEHGLAKFLKGKGASCKVVAGIVSRYPRAITRSIEHLERRWELWRDIFETDAHIVSILDRSPESFFRSSDNENLKKNIAFLTSLGLNNKDLHRLLTKAPRTFSNSLELNKQMVEFLEEVCVELGGEKQNLFPKSVISKNLYILIRSTKRVKTNIDILRAFLELSNSELLDILQGPVAQIIDLSNVYLKNNFHALQQRLVSNGCGKSDLKNLVLRYPMVLFTGSETLSSKMDCLVRGGITMKQILEKPKVLDYSIQNITGRLEELHRVRYDFEKKGISILDSSKKRFAAKMEKLETEGKFLHYDVT